MKKPTLSIRTSLSSTFLSALLLLALSGPMAAQTYEQLNELPGHQVKTYFSDGAETQAREMAARCDRVLDFYKPLIEFSPEVSLLVLSPEDWGQYTNFPVYGMPHYTDAKTLIVASQDNDFWKSFIPPLDQLPAALADRIRAAYQNSEGGLSMKPFFDLLAIHELGHGFHFQGGLTMQRLWMGELFANILLHTYIAEIEPELLPALSVFPEMVVSSTDPATLKFTTLTELETNYNLIGQQYPQNYGWYQCRWHRAAGHIYDEGGTDAFIRLWQALKNQTEPLDDAAFAELLSGKVHHTVADVLVKWDKP